MYLLDGRTTHRCSISMLGWRIPVPTPHPYSMHFQCKVGWRQNHRKQVPPQQLVSAQIASFFTLPLFTLVYLNVCISRWLETCRSNLLLDNGTILLGDFLSPENTVSSCMGLSGIPSFLHTLTSSSLVRSLGERNTELP